jgi:hypothetical protein
MPIVSPNTSLTNLTLSEKVRIRTYKAVVVDGLDNRYALRFKRVVYRRRDQWEHVLHNCYTGTFSLDEIPYLAPGTQREKGPQPHKNFVLNIEIKELQIVSRVDLYLLTNPLQETTQVLKNSILSPWNLVVVMN